MPEVFSNRRICLWFQSITIQIPRSDHSLLYETITQQHKSNNRIALNHGCRRRFPRGCSESTVANTSANCGPLQTRERDVKRFAGFSVKHRERVPLKTLEPGNINIEASRLRLWEVNEAFCILWTGSNMGADSLLHNFRYRLHSQRTSFELPISD